MMKQTLKKSILATALSAAMMLSALPAATTFAKSASFQTSVKNTSKLTVKEVDYDLNDRHENIELEFSGTVKRKASSKVTVKDTSGKSYKTSIHDYDSNDLSLDVAGLKAGKTYTVTITNIKKSSASSYGTLSVKFTVPKASTSLVKDVDYDREDREVTFDFRSNVKYSNAKVTITSTDGKKTYTTRILEKENDELTVSVKGLQAGKKYSYKITGVRKASASKATTLSGMFTAIDND